MRTFVVTVILVLVAACGDDSSTGPGTPSDEGLSMQVDGVPFNPSTVTAQRAGGVVSIAAVDQAAVTGFGLGIPDSGPGTYTVAQNEVVILYNSSAGGWAASVLQGGSGSITVTTLTADRFAGTFSAVLPAQSGQMPATVSITNGSFDLSINTSSF